jgi:predicted anti-sigma-YlaC factor YlaD
MNHQPFEEWLLMGEPLGPGETAELQEHLQGCENCRKLSFSLQAVERELRAAPEEAPLQGFTDRWQKRLEADRSRLHRRQSLAFLAFAIGGAVLVIASLLILALPLIESPNVLLWTGVYRMLRLVTVADVAEDLLSSLFRTATGTIPWTWWVLFLGILTELGVLWVVSLRMLTNPRRVSR